MNADYVPETVMALADRIRVVPAADLAPMFDQLERQIGWTRASDLWHAACDEATTYEPDGGYTASPQWGGA